MRIFTASLVTETNTFSPIPTGERSFAERMLRRGDGCTAFGGGEARSRVSLKELRRSGLGHLAVADLNGDGWIDGRDIARFLEHGGPQRPTAERLDRRDW